MSVVINELEVIAPPPSREEVRETMPQNLPQAGPTPEDIYWVLRRLVERELRLQAD